MPTDSMAGGVRQFADTLVAYGDNDGEEPTWPMDDPITMALMGSQRAAPHPPGTA